MKYVALYAQRPNRARFASSETVTDNLDKFTNNLRLINSIRSSYRIAKYGAEIRSSLFPASRVAPGYLLTRKIYDNRIRRASISFVLSLERSVSPSSCRSAVSEMHTFFKGSRRHGGLSGRERERSFHSTICLNSSSQNDEVFSKPHHRLVYLSSRFKYAKTLPTTLSKISAKFLKKSGKLTEDQNTCAHKLQSHKLRASY